jgi:hypothetical protein
MAFARLNKDSTDSSNCDVLALSSPSVFSSAAALNPGILDLSATHDMVPRGFGFDLPTKPNDGLNVGVTQAAWLHALDRFSCSASFPSERPHTSNVQVTHYHFVQAGCPPPDLWSNDRRMPRSSTKTSSGLPSLYVSFWTIGYKPRYS